MGKRILSLFLTGTITWSQLSLPAYAAPLTTTLRPEPVQASPVDDERLLQHAISCLTARTAWPQIDPHLQLFQDEGFLDRLVEWMDDRARRRTILVEGDTIAAGTPGFFLAWQLALERFQQRRGFADVQAAADASAVTVLIHVVPSADETPHDALSRFLRDINEDGQATDLEPSWCEPVVQPPSFPIDLAIGAPQWLTTFASSASTQVALAPLQPSQQQEAPAPPAQDRAPNSSTHRLAAGVLFGALMWWGAPFGPIPLLIVLASGIAHEFAHAWAATRLGDPTPRQAGRLTLLRFWRHLDPIGTVALIAIWVVLGVPVVGWFKPMPVSPRHLGSAGMRTMALAGPGMSLLLAGLLSATALLAEAAGASSGWVTPLAFGAAINFVFGLFNLLPIGRLDGSLIFPRLAHIPLAAAGAVGAAFGLPMLCASCRAMQLQQQLEQALFDKRDRQRMAEAAKQLNALMTELGRQLAEAAARDAAVQSQVDADDAAHAATHAAEAALDEAISATAPTAEAFEATFTAHLLPEMRRMAIKADDEGTVRRLLQALQTSDGRTPQQALQQWLRDFNIMPALQHAAQHRTGTPHHHSPPHPHPHHHDEEQGGGGAGTHGVVASLLFTVGAGLATALTGLPFLRLSVKPTVIEPLEVYLKKISALNDEERKFLLAIATDPAQEGESGGPLVGRSNELARVTSCLNTPFHTKNNAILVGPRGVGKTVLVELIAGKLARAEVIGHLKGRRIISVPAGALGTGPQLLENLNQLIAILRKTDNTLILFMDEICSLLKGPSNTVDSRAADLLKPVLEKGFVTMLGATTDPEYKAYIEQDPAFEDRFTKIQIPESSLPETESILRGTRQFLEAKFGIRIGRDAMTQAVHGSERYLPEKSQPRKALDVLKGTIGQQNNRANRLRLHQEDFLGRLQAAVRDYIELRKEGRADDARELVEAHNRLIGNLIALQEVTGQLTAFQTTGRLTGDDVLGYLAELTGVPVEKLGEEDAQKYLRMEEELHKRVVGQDEAVRAISQTIRRNVTGMRDPHRPIGVFYCAGTSGVGKTKLAKALADFLFGEESAMTRVDMTEYQQEHNVARLTGSPPGYIGHEKGGQLTEAVRKRPYSVLLFDEIEKAHPKVLEVLMQVFDEGRLTDGQGNTVDFTNTVILLSSNIGMHEIQDALRSLSEQLAAADTPEASTAILTQMNQLVAKAVSETIHRRYKSEIVNRIDRIIPYEVLTPDHVRQIARIEVAQALKPLVEKGYGLNVDERLYAALAQPGRGYDVLNGARPLRRLIEQEISTPLSTYLLEQTAQGRTAHGGTVRLSVDANDTPVFAFEPAAPTAGRLEPSPEIAPVFERLMRLIDETIDSPQDTVELDALARLVPLGRAAAQGTQLSGPFGSFWARTPSNISPAVTPVRSHHNDPTRKDGAIEGLLQRQVTQNDRLAAASKPLVEQWVREFVRLAKSYNRGTAIDVRVAAHPDGRLEFIEMSREGNVSTEEEAWLRAHLTPEATSPEQATELAQSLVAQNVPDVRRALIELKTTLAAAGASFGFSENDAGVTYWLKLPVATQPAQGSRLEAEGPGTAPAQPVSAQPPIGLTPTQRAARLEAQQPAQGSGLGAGDQAPPVPPTSLTPEQRAARLAAIEQALQLLDQQIIEEFQTPTQGMQSGIVLWKGRRITLGMGANDQESQAAENVYEAARKLVMHAERELNASENVRAGAGDFFGYSYSADLVEVTRLGIVGPGIQVRLRNQAAMELVFRLLIDWLTKQRDALAVAEAIDVVVKEQEQSMHAELARLEAQQPAQGSGLGAAGQGTGEVAPSIGSLESRIAHEREEIARLESEIDDLRRRYPNPDEVIGRDQDAEPLTGTYLIQHKEGNKAACEARLVDLLQKAANTSPAQAAPSGAEGPPAYGAEAYFSGGERVPWGTQVGKWSVSANGSTWTIVKNDPKTRITADWNSQFKAYVINGGVPIFAPDLTQPLRPFSSPAAALAAGIAAVDAGSRKPPTEVMQRFGLDFDEMTQMIIVQPLNPPTPPDLERRLRDYQRRRAARRNA